MTTLHTLHVDGVTVLKLEGPLNHEGLEQIEAPFTSAVSAPGLRAVVDLTDVDLVTTPALTLFISACTAARRTGGRLVFTEASPPVTDVLHRLRLHTVLQTIPGRDEAIHAARQ